MSLVEIFVLPVNLVQASPILALVPAAAAFLAFYLVPQGTKRRGWILAAGTLWALFGAYEASLSSWNETAVAPIRVDLLLLTPLLYALTFVGLIVCWRAVRPSDTSRGDAA